MTSLITNYIINPASDLLSCGGRRRKTQRNGIDGNGPYSNLEAKSKVVEDDATPSSLPMYIAFAVAGFFLVMWITTPSFFTPEGLLGMWTYLNAPTDDETCEDGLFIAGPMPSLLNVALYTSLLIWSFIGVAIAADKFMVAIEYITSQTVTKKLITPNGVKPMTVYIWNGTIANLTLMALGSSAPEILLSIIEIVSSGFYAGELGPSTIVGSAAFNLLGISSVCVLAIPVGQSRYIKETMVFACTAFFSVFAYAWLYIILVMITPNIVDVWEGLATLFLFPLLVTLAYIADIKLCAAPASSSALLDVNKFGKGVTKDDVVLALKNSGYADADPSSLDASVLSSALSYALAPTSRAFYRVNAIRGGLAGRKAQHGDPEVQAALEARGTGAGPMEPVEVGFEMGAMVVQEGGVQATMRVLLNRASTKPVSVRYETVGATATAGEDFVHVSGTLLFPPGATAREVRVPIIDDDIAEEDETFYVQLSNAQGAELSKLSRCTVTIEDDDLPGELKFTEELVTCTETCGVLKLIVRRSNGSKGAIACEYATRDGTAVAPSDYLAVSGTLHFASGVVEQTIEVPIIDDARYEADETFQVVLTETTGGATFDKDADGYPDRAICTVTIKNNEDRAQVVDSVSNLLDLNVDNIELAASGWVEQFYEAVAFEGDSGIDMFLYLLSVPWKVTFAFVPPPRLAGGWLCFIIALIGIGALTALIGDLASHMGCCMGLLPSVTAITFVALGTSLPDTFASAQAAVKEIYADASIGNITGSNSVNVFLGLGLPWATAALYWASPSASAAAAWHDRYAHEPWYTPGMPIGFAVPAGDLGFSVGVFCSCAVVCLGTLVWRRAVLGAELGGPIKLRYLTATLFTFLWFVYIAASTANAYGMI